MTSVRLKSIRKSFAGPDGTTKVVFTDLSHEVFADRFTTVIGANGSGKTTMLNLVAGLTTPDGGTIELLDGKLGPPKVGYVWQDYRASLLPWLHVLDNITFPLRLEGLPAEERRKIGENTLSKFMPGIDPKTPCYELSGGQQQLLCLLRSACAHPDVLLLDEPFSALDQPRSWRMAAYVEQVWNDRQVPTLFVSHDVDEGILLADEIVLLSNAVGGIGLRVRNELPRPRRIEMLNSEEHLRCRRQVLEFLFDTGLEVPRPARDLLSQERTSS